MIQHTFTQSVKVLAGAGCVSQIGDVLEERGYHKAILVYDRGVEAAGIPQKVIKSLENKGIGYISYTNVLPDPPAHTIDEGAAVCAENGCDCIIAIGGGSTIDTAKGINILRFNGGKLLDYETNPDYRVCSGLIAVPTTSGTGSELSNGAIVTDTEHDRKVPILCFNNMCEYAVLDPELTAGMPPRLTLLTGLDVFSHAAESYTVRQAGMMSDLICEAVMRSVVESLPAAVADGKNISARGKMQAAAAAAGWGLYMCCSHVGHSLAHVLGGSLHMVHGAACAYGLPGVLEFISAACPEKVRKIGEILGAEYTGEESAGEIGEKAADQYRQFCRSIGLPEVEDYDLTDDELDDLARQVVQEAFAGFSPVEVTEESARVLLEKALNKKR